MKFFITLLIATLSACTVSTSPKTDTDAIIEAVLSHGPLAEFLHPEIPGRLPVEVVLDTAGTSPLNATAFGQPVRVTTAEDPQAIILSIEVLGDKASVTLSYPEEGLGGNIDLKSQNGTWKVTSEKLWEQRSNHSFKPSPPRGAT